MPSYVVAGASRGIGLEFLVQLLAKGNIVIALARNPSSAAGLEALKDNKNLHILKADITDVVSLRNAADETAKITGGSLDVLINNGAFIDQNNQHHGIFDFPDDASLAESFNRSWTTNVMGPIWTTIAFLPLLRKGSLKKILTLSSGMGDPAFNLAARYPSATAYAISKSALEMVNVKFALALENEGFIALAISPGVVNTAQAPPSPEDLVGIQKMIAAAKSVYPDWKGPITPTESVSRMLGVLDNAKPSDNGKFVSHLGNRQWL